MAKFDFFNVPRILFGRGQFARAGELSAQLGRCALIVFNGPDALSDKLTAQLSGVGLAYEKFRQRGEPKVEDVDAALDVARRNAADMVIGLGGGSAIDAAKAVAALLSNGGSALDYMEVVGKGQKITKTAAPWVAIPATAGTGAEVTRNAVIGAPQHRFKASIRGEQLLARVALVDPELGVSTPPGVTAASGMDALCQCIESYTSSGAQPITDALALQGISAAARSLRRAVEDGQNVEAREDMALAALLSGITLTNAGLGAVHGFAAPLGANFPAPHGAICAALLAPVIDANVAALRTRDSSHFTLMRYAAVGRALTGNPALGGPEAIDAAIVTCTALTRDLNIPPLREFGMTEQHVAPMVALAKKASSMRFNPIDLSDAALDAVLRKGMGI